MLKKIPTATLVAAATLLTLLAVSLQAQAGDAYNGHKPVFKTLVKGGKVFTCKFWSKHRYTCQFSHDQKRRHGKPFTFKPRSSHGRDY